MSENLASGEFSEITRNVSRREALKKIIFGTLALVGIQIGVAKAVDIPDRDVPMRASEHKSDYELNGCMIQVLAIEHNVSSANNSYLDEYVTPFKGILVPEYFPPEYNDNGNIITRAIAKIFKSSNSLFDYFTTIVKQEGKSVLVLDPAWSNQFVTASALLSSPNLVGGYYTLSAVTNGLQASREESVRENPVNHPVQISRRDFLLSSARAIAAVGTLATFFPLMEALEVPLLGAEFSFGRLEDDIRYVLIAHKLTELSLMRKISDIMLIYPPVHWAGIRFYLDNPDQRENRMRTYRKILPESIFPDLYATRKYFFDHGKMIKE